MAIDFQQIQQQITRWGETAEIYHTAAEERRQLAFKLLEEFAGKGPALQDKVIQTVRLHDPNLRCALPGAEPLDAGIPAPEGLEQGTLIAADGSQINPDRHAEVDFSLINVGAIAFQLGSSRAPGTSITSQLLYDEQLYTHSGLLTDAMLALMRDLNERQVLLRLAGSAPRRPVITFTDGPLELWGAHDPGSASAYQEKLQAYLDVLAGLRDQDVITAGYVDNPGANLVSRLLEVAVTPADELPDLAAQPPQKRPLFRVNDSDLFARLLPPGRRSAVFALQSKSSAAYRGSLGLHFFYVNVGRSNVPALARVEIPAWVAQDPASVAALHAVLVEQCRILGTQPYPYLLHRAHEAAVVSLQEKDQLTQMIILALRQRGIPVGRRSPKQSLKGLPRRSRR